MRVDRALRGSASSCAGSGRARRGPVGHPNRITAGLLVRPKFEQSAFLRIAQHVVERPETVETLVEARLAPFNGLFDHGTPDWFAAAAFLGQSFQGFNDEFQRVVQVRPLPLAWRALTGRAFNG